jgi:hypothetical protein
MFQNGTISRDMPTYDGAIDRKLDKTANEK